MYLPGRDKRPVKSLVVGRPILLALEDIDGGPSFLEKALRFLEKYGKLRYIILLVLVFELHCTCGFFWLCCKPSLFNSITSNILLFSPPFPSYD